MSQYTFFKKIPNVFELKADLMKKEDFSKPEWIAIGSIVANKTCNDEMSNKDKKNKESVMGWIRAKAADHNRENPTDLINSISMRNLLIDFNIEYERKQRQMDADLDDSNMRNQQKGNLKNLPPMNLSDLSRINFLNQSQNSEILTNNDSSYSQSEFSGNNGNNNNNNNNSQYSSDLNTNTGRTPTKLRTEKNAQRADLNRSKLLEMNTDLLTMQNEYKNTLERVELKISEAMKFTSGSVAHQSKENEKLKKQMDNLSIIHNHKMNEYDQKLKKKQREIEALKLETAQLRAEKEKYEEKRRENEMKIDMDVDGNVINDANDLKSIEKKMERHENKMRNIYKDLTENREKILLAASANNASSNLLTIFDIAEEDKPRVIKLSLVDSEKFSLVDYETAIIAKLVQAEIDCNKYIESKDGDLRIKICSMSGGRKVARIYFSDSFGTKTAIESLQAVGGVAGYWRNSKEMNLENIIQRQRRQQIDNVAHLNVNNQMYQHYDPTQSAMFAAEQQFERRGGYGRGRGEGGRGRNRGNYAQRGGNRGGNRYYGKNNGYYKNNRNF